MFHRENTFLVYTVHLFNIISEMASVFFKRSDLRCVSRNWILPRSRHERVLACRGLELNGDPLHHWTTCAAGNKGISCYVHLMGSPLIHCDVKLNSFEDSLAILGHDSITFVLIRVWLQWNWPYLWNGKHFPVSSCLLISKNCLYDVHNIVLR